MEVENTARPGITWEDFWASGVGKGDYFDAEKALPELQAALDEKRFKPGARALVPGCGRGYAVEAIRKSDLYDQVVGVDLSSTAVKAAKEYLDSRGLDGTYDVIEGDFFEDEFGSFDFVYDYTFFCAIPPEWRPKWGAVMKKLLKPGGTLVTVMFPVGKPRETGGPPYGVSAEDYEQVLEGFVAKDGPRVLEDDRAHGGRGNGMTMWCAWERT